MKKINKKLIGVITIIVILVGLCIANFAFAYPYVYSVDPSSSKPSLTCSGTINKLVFYYVGGNSWSTAAVDGVGDHMLASQVADFCGGDNNMPDQATLDKFQAQLNIYNAKQGKTGTALDTPLPAGQSVTLTPAPKSTPTPNDPSACKVGATHSDPAKWTPLIQCGNADQPCCDVTELFILINRIINWFLSIAGSIAAITFTIAGANILMHPDKQEEITKAKSMLTKTIVGLLIILGSWLVFHTVLSGLIDSSALRFLGN